MSAKIVQLPSGLDAAAERIRSLMKDWANNSIKLGKELKAVRDDSFPLEFIGKRYRRNGWKEWLKKEVNLGENHASSLIRTASLVLISTGESNQKIATEVLKRLTSKSTPEAGKTEIRKRIEAGEKISPAKAKEIVDSHRPKPAVANKQAKETGKAVLASDGYLYLGGDPKEVKKATERRTIVFAVRRAVETLALIQLTPTEFLDCALPHQLWTKKEGSQIEIASDWLRGLTTAWGKR